MKSCCRETLKLLAEAMKKTVRPEIIDEIKWSGDPLGQFLKVLRDESQEPGKERE